MNKTEGFLFLIIGTLVLWYGVENWREGFAITIYVACANAWFAAK